jgi:hypothetical protein
MEFWKYLKSKRQINDLVLPKALEMIGRNLEIDSPLDRANCKFPKNFQRFGNQLGCLFNCQGTKFFAVPFDLAAVDQIFYGV